MMTYLNLAKKYLCHYLLTLISQLGLDKVAIELRDVK